MSGAALMEGTPKRGLLPAALLPVPPPARAPFKASFTDLWPAHRASSTARPPPPRGLAAAAPGRPQPGPAPGRLACGGRKRGRQVGTLRKAWQQAQHRSEQMDREAQARLPPGHRHRTAQLTAWRARRAASPDT